MWQSSSHDVTTPSLPTSMSKSSTTYAARGKVSHGRARPCGVCEMWWDAGGGDQKVWWGMVRPTCHLEEDELVSLPGSLASGLRVLDL